MNSTVTKITIGRLFNLGSYEHIRYEITVEVPPASDPAAALIGLETILDAMNPKRPCGVSDDSTLECMANEIRRITRMSRADWEYTRWCEMDQAQCIAEKEAELAKCVAKTEHWKRRQAKARQLLSDLGAAVLYKDAKDDWDDDNDRF
jgi:hypothetical protein